jgi:hypothetical protein
MRLDRLVRSRPPVRSGIDRPSIGYDLRSRAMVRRIPGKPRRVHASSALILGDDPAEQISVYRNCFVIHVDCSFVLELAEYTKQGGTSHADSFGQPFLAFGHGKPVATVVGSTEEVMRQALTYGLELTLAQTIGQKRGPIPDIPEQAFQDAWILGAESKH